MPHNTRDTSTDSWPRRLRQGSRGVVESLDSELFSASVERALFGEPRAVLLGRYQALEFVARGGGGSVYRAHDPTLDRPVAIKVITLDDHDHDLDLDRVRGEAIALARLNHPNVVQVYDTVLVDDALVIVMQWVEGLSADRWISEHAPSPRSVLALYAAAGRGLAETHRAGLVHRDFKPSNVLVESPGPTTSPRARLGDFGLALVATLDPSQRTTVAGTAAYMAPEQLAGAAVDARTDQYSFCVAVFEALTGTLPPRTPDGTVLRTRADRLLRAHDTALTGRQRRALLRGLAARPTQRFDRMERLLAELAAPQPIRIGMVLATTAALAVIATPWVPVPSTGTMLPCDLQSEDLHQVWAHYSETSARAFERLASTRADTHDRLDAAMHRYATAWRGAYAETCDASMAVGERRRRQRCLDERLWTATSLVEQLAATKDPTVMFQSVSAVHDLPAPTECRSTQTAGVSDWMPDDPSRARQTTRLRSALAEATASVLAGQYADAQRQLDPIVRDAAAAGLDPLLLRAQLQLGHAQLSLGRTEQAEASLVSAHASATEQHFDLEAAQAATHLAYVVGYQRRDTAKGVDWTRHALAALDRLELDGPRRAAVWDVLGIIEVTSGDHDRAWSHMQRALEIRERTPDLNPVALASTLHNMGNVALGVHRLDEARRYYARALALRTEAFGPVHPLVGLSVNGMGTVALYDGDPDTACTAFARAIRILSETVGPEHYDLLMLHINLSAASMDSGDLATAKTHALAAVEVAEHALPSTHPETGSAHLHLAAVHSMTGNSEAALASMEHGLAILREALGPEHPVFAASLHEAGMALQRLGDHEQAVEYFERSSALNRATYGPDDIAVLLPMAGRVVSLVALGQSDTALTLLQRITETPGYAELPRDVREDIEQAGREATAAVP